MEPVRLNDPKAATQRGDTAFLKRCILRETTKRGGEYLEALTQAEQHEASAGRAVWTVVRLIIISGIGFYVCLALNQNLLDSREEAWVHGALKLFIWLGLAASMSLVVFLGVWAYHWQRLEDQRERCRNLLANILAARLPNASNSEKHDTRSRRTRKRQTPMNAPLKMDGNSTPQPTQPPPPPQIVPDFAS
jgi:hypothetical protein